MIGRLPLWKEQRGSRARMGKKRMKGGVKKKAVEKEGGRVAKGGMQLRAEEF